VLISAGCGGGSSDSSTTTPKAQTTLTKRAFLLNQFFSTIQIIDAQKDLFSGATIAVDAQPQIMQVLSNKQTLVYSGSNNAVTLVDNATESNPGAFKALPGATESIVVTPDNKLAYAAIPSTGKIAILDLVAKTDATVIPTDSSTIAGVRRLVMTKNGNTILAFSDNSDSVTFIDVAHGNAITTIGGFNRPFTALISSDDSKAYVLNCGLECGGSAAGVAVVDLTSKAITTAVPLRAATLAVADNSNLYVAGTDVSTHTGILSVISLSSLVPPATTQTISDGLHTTMALASNNKLYIGSRACSNSGSTGGLCLSVYDIGKQSATIIAGTTNSPAVGDVQAITPIKNRNAVYVIQNGLLSVYDSATDTPQATPTILVTGKVIDVKEVD
jgi:hypothetical protein